MFSPVTIGVVAVVGLIVFGPKRIPEVANALGKSLNEFKKGMREAESSFKDGYAEPTPPAIAPTSTVAEQGHPTGTSETRS